MSFPTKILVCFVVLFVFIGEFGVGTTTSAQEPTPSDAGPGFVLLQELPGIEANTPPDIVTYLQTLYQILLGVLIAIGVIKITWGGIVHQFSESALKKEGALSAIFTALGAILIAGSIVLVFNTIDPSITSFGFFNKLQNLVGETVSGGLSF